MLGSPGAHAETHAAGGVVVLSADPAAGWGLTYSVAHVILCTDRQLSIPRRADVRDVAATVGSH